MNSNQAVRNGNTTTKPMEREHTLSPRRRMLVSLGVALGLIAIAVALGLVLSSCGPQAEEPVASSSSAAPVEEVVLASVGGTGGESLGSTSGSIEAPSAPSPDVDATVTQSIVMPGDSVEVIARATPDAISLTLWDGYGDRTLFVFDEATNLWRAVYRVPMRASWERLGLSVTAHNESNRWSRVWVFLSQPKEEGSLQESDSLGN